MYFVRLPDPVQPGRTFRTRTPIGFRDQAGGVERVFPLAFS